MANYMAEVAKMLGVELGEEFQCNETSYTYWLTEHSVMCSGCYAADSLVMLLNGALTIKRKPWKPQKNEEYWTVMRDGEVFLATWLNDLIDIHCYKLGNCYRTKEEAEANCDKWISFYASDEVLEVLR